LESETTQPEVSIIIPAYNEEQRLPLLLPELLSFCSRNLSNYEIIIIDDGSTDGTKEVVRKLSKGKSEVRLISYPKNRGKGGAIKEGFKAAEGRYVIFMDADGSISPEEIPQMLRALEKNEVVVGTRISPESKILKPQPFYRVIAGKVFNHLVNLMFPIKIYDTLCGFKGFHHHVAKELAEEIISEGWEFDVELIWRVRKKGYSIVELPIKWKDVGESKLSILRDPLKILINLIKVRVSE